MPKLTFIPFKLPMAIPDQCLCCPFLGIIPQEDRKKESPQKIYCCIMCGKPLSLRYVRSKMSDHDSKHPMHKPCEKRFNLDRLANNNIFKMGIGIYNRYRLPFEERQQSKLTLDWD